MKKFTISLGIFLLFSFLFLLGGCQEGITTSPTPPTPAPTSAPTTGSISGIVTEMDTGVPLENVTITVDGRTTTTTASDGSYSITNLSPGFHTLKFEKVGYMTETANVNVTAGTNTPKAMELLNTTTTTKIDISHDTYIYTGCPVNGTQPLILFGAFASTLEVRAIFSFSTSFCSFPQDAKAISAKLKLYKVNTNPLTGSIPYAVYPITEEWDESVATWLMRTSSAPWFTAGGGGSYDENFKISEGEFTLGGFLTWEEVDVTKAFEYWQQGHDNYGIILLTKQTTGAYCNFASRDNPNQEFRPYVEVEYYIP